MVKEEFFIVDIIFNDRVRLNDVEMSQAAINWYLERQIPVVFDAATIPPDISEEPEIEDPDDEPTILPGEPINPRSIELIISRAVYGPSNNPEKNEITVTIISRLKDKTAMIDSAILVLRVKDSNMLDVDFKQFTLNRNNLSFQQDFSF